jgi:membrane-bound metal-dependent hydrolase YbcI (DUF457 family)
LDALTHILIGYSIGNLLAINSFELIACIATSAALDLDILISRSSIKSIKYHRDFSHSLLFTLILSISLAAFSALFNQAFLRVFFLALLSSLFHVFLDFSTTWGIPLLYPVKTYSSLKLDTAVNPILLMASFLMLIVIAISNSSLLSLIAILLLIFYLSMRAILKQIAARMLSAKGEIALLPTFSPFIWKALQSWRSEGGFTLKTGFMYILQSRYEEINTRTFPYSPEEIGKAVPLPPLENERAAILFSSSIEPVKIFCSKFKYSSAKAVLEDEIWRVTWVPSEIDLRIEVLISKNGEIAKVESNWHR